jgi:hypothetical protein
MVSNKKLSPPKGHRGDRGGEADFLNDPFEDGVGRLDNKAASYWQRQRQLPGWSDLEACGLQVYDPAQQLWSTWLDGFVQREQIRRPRRWIFGFEIADWVARQNGSIIVPQDRLAQAYTALIRALLAGEFEMDGHALRWLPGEFSSLNRFGPLGAPSTRMSRDRLASLAERFGDINDPQFWEVVIKQLAVRADACRRYFEAEGISARPGWGLDAPPESQVVSGAAKPKIAPQPAGAEDPADPEEFTESDDTYIPPPKEEAAYQRDDRHRAIAVMRLAMDDKEPLSKIANSLHTREPSVSRASIISALSNVERGGGRGKLLSKARMKPKAVSAL